MSVAPVFSGQKCIRQELEGVERRANLSFSNWARSEHYKDFHLAHFHHWMRRRRFLIKELVEVQIKEFNHD